MTRRTKIAGAAMSALVALTMAGGVAIGFAKDNPNVAVAQAANLASQETPAAHPAHTVTLYKSPTCVCCGKWGDHLREHGFEVREEITGDI